MEKIEIEKLLSTCVHDFPQHFFISFQSIHNSHYEIINSSLHIFIIYD
jgi:hypothetical protein